MEWIDDFDKNRLADFYYLLNPEDENCYEFINIKGKILTPPKYYYNTFPVDEDLSGECNTL